MKARDEPDTAQQAQNGMSEQQLQEAGAEPDAAADGEPDRFELELASINDFQQTKIVRLLETIDTLEFYSLDSQLSALSRQALVEGQRRAYRAYRVLMVMCSYHFSVDRHDAFGPRMTRDGMRTPIPADIAGEQSQILAAIAETIDHPLLRARVADVAWYNHRSLHKCADLSIEAYCQAIEFYLDDKLSFSYEPPLRLVLQSRRPDPHRTAAGRDSALKHLPYPHSPKAKAAAIAGLPFARTILGSARDRHGNL